MAVCAEIVFVVAVLLCGCFAVSCSPAWIVFCLENSCFVSVADFITSYYFPSINMVTF